MDKTRQQPTSQELKRLYDLAAELKALAPWRWMEEDDLFGVENPESGEVGFVSVMGQLGEPTALAVYIGAKGLYGFLELEEIELEVEPFALLDIPQLQVSFEDRDLLEKRDRDEIEKLGLKFRGAGAYPLFRSIRSGFLPWFITSDEARFLIHAIEQTLEVAPRVEQDAEVLGVEDDTDGDIYLIRVAENTDAGLVWRDEMRKIREPEPERITFDVSDETLARLKRYPRNNHLVFEVDLFATPIPTLSKDKRPFVPKMLMVAERDSRFILGAELLEPAETTHELVEAAAAKLFEIWESHKVIPKEILVGSDVVYAVLRHIAQKLNTSLRQTNDLIAINDACDEMFKGF